MKTTPFFVLLAALLAISACQPAATSRPTDSPTLPPKGSIPMFPLTSPSFKAGESIPAVYTCAGRGISPQLAWSGAPAGVQSFALIMDDPDAPGNTFVHWVLYNIPASSAGLAENAGAEAQPADGSVQGKNSAGKAGYVGPCPPSGTHHYHFKLYALDTKLGQMSMNKDALLKAMQGHILAQGELMGTFKK
ncbi:MAG: YbhB/YbcL family Raf kinase inhibitor-like protein [Anaerolineales bacterium]